MGLRMRCIKCQGISYLLAVGPPGFRGNEQCPNRNQVCNFEAMERMASPLCSSHAARVTIARHPPALLAYSNPHPHSFGERITIERSIKAAGGTDVKLLDERGKRVTVGKPRDTLFAMLEHFCIDVTNPLTIITQDKARQFLSSEAGWADRQCWRWQYCRARAGDGAEASGAQTRCVHVYAPRVSPSPAHFSCYVTPLVCMHASRRHGPGLGPGQVRHLHGGHTAAAPAGECTAAASPAAPAAY